MLLLRLEYRRLSTANALDPGLLDAQWHDMKDTDVEEMLKDEECWYGTPCTGVNLNGMNHTVYNLRGMGLCMASRASYNTALCYFFSMNLFRCVNFADLKGFRVSRQTCSHDPEDPGRLERWCWMRRPVS